MFLLLRCVIAGAMARGRAKKSAQKGKGKATGPSSSPVKKTKSVDEVTGVSELRIPSPIPEKEVVSSKSKDEVTQRMSTPVAMEEQQMPEQSAISEWRDVMTSGAKNPTIARRMSWADDVEQQEVNQVSNKSPTVHIVSDDIQEEVEYWSSAVVCYVLGANPPFKVMDGFFRRIWGKLGIEKTAMVGKGMFIVRFATVEACLKVTTDGFQFFDQKPVITRMWDADMPLDKECIQKVPIWIKLPGLALKYWGEKSLYKIVGLVGDALQMDKATKMKDRLQYARVMVEIQLQQDLPEVIYFCNEHGNVIDKQVEYEWRPTLCKKCGGIGHSEEECRKGGPAKKWVPKKQVRVDEEGFQMVGSGAGIIEKQPELPVHNSFMALMDEQEIDKVDEVKEKTSAAGNISVTIISGEENRESAIMECKGAEQQGKTD